MRRFGDGGELVVNGTNVMIVVNLRLVDGGELIEPRYLVSHANRKRMSTTPADAREGNQVNWGV